MKILVVGGGGREHAITSALSRTSENEIYSVMAKKNPGIAQIAKQICLAPETDMARIVAFAKKRCHSCYYRPRGATRSRCRSTGSLQQVSLVSDLPGQRHGSRRTRLSAGIS